MRTMTGDDWILLVILVPLVLLSMMAHELAHAWIAYRLGDPTAKSRGRLTVNPLKHLDPLGAAMFVITYLFSSFVFGWAKPVPVNPYYFKSRQRGMALVGAAGPITNFALAILFIVVLNLIHPTNWWGFMVFYMAFQVNLALGLFNLVPIPPLDGSRVLGAFLPREAYEKWAALDQYGMLIFIAVIVIFRNSFFGALGWAVEGVAKLFLSNYPGLFS
jgi:Zn-dependent protease